LDDHIQHFALVINGTPEVHALPADVHDHFVEVPATARRRSAPLQIAGDLRSEFDRPATDGLVTDVNSTLGQHFFDVAETHCEAEIQPHAIADDIGWKPMPLE
jgi:hypothetical protein